MGFENEDNLLGARPLVALEDMLSENGKKIMERQKLASRLACTSFGDIADIFFALRNANAELIRQRDELAAALEVALHKLRCPLTHCKECDAFRLYDNPSAILRAVRQRAAAWALKQAAEKGVVISGELLDVADRFERGDVEVPNE